jgi:hypothetical protein
MAVVVLQELLVVGSCCVLFRQSDICIGGWDWKSWTLVSNCAFAVFSCDFFPYIHINTYIEQINYLFPGKYYRRQHRTWVFVSFVQKTAI